MRKPHLLSSAMVQGRIIGALMLRETMARYGHENIGFFWLIAEPLLLTLGVMGVWMITGMHQDAEIGVIPFVLTGYAMVTLWRHIIFRSVHALRQNVGLLFHMNVRSFDILFARALLDTIGNLAAFFVAYVPLSLTGLLQPMHDPLLLIGGWFLFAWFAFALGLNLAGLSEMFEPLEWFVHPIMYLILPISGTFFMVSWLPDNFQELVLWCPLVHANEMFRAGLFPPDVPTTWDAWFLLLWCIGLTATGLPLIRHARDHVRMS